jgi:hypothetical protein
MATAAFQFNWRGGEPLGGLTRFDPAGRLEGVAQILPKDNIRSKHVVVRIGRHTEGHGDRDGAMIGELQMAQGQLTANTPLTQSFSIDLPRERWSFAGH